MPPFRAAGAAARALHVDPYQEERFEIREGTVRFRGGWRDEVATAGEIIVVPTSTAHLPMNIRETEAHCVAEFRPALNIETFFENGFALLNARVLERAFR